MNDEHIAAYVASTAIVLGLSLPAERVARVAAHLQRTAAMAALLDTALLVPHDEPAEIFSPAAFPPNNHGRHQL